MDIRRLDQSKRRASLSNRLEGQGNDAARFLLRAGAEVNTMLLILGIILLVIWGFGFLAFHVAGGLIHVLIVLAVISFLVHLFRGRRVA